MPIKIPDALPAVQTLLNENIFVMTEKRAMSQDIRPLRILLFNLMPTKIVTETQILRALSNSPLQVEVVFLNTKTHASKNTPHEHLVDFYKTFDEIENEKFDGMIITGAPVENMVFEEVDYWDELTSVMEWSKSHVTSTLHICWGAQAGLYYHYGIKKHRLEKKMSGVFEHRVQKKKNKLVRGFDETFFAPHSRHTETRIEEVKAVPELDIIAVSDEAGLYLAASKDGKHVFVMGHSEYDADTLDKEYKRDSERGLNPEIPVNYYKNNNPLLRPVMRWRAHSTLLFVNWLNYCVYQITPYNLNEIK